MEDPVFGFRAAGPALLSNVSYFEQRDVPVGPEDHDAAGVGPHASEHVCKPALQVPEDETADQECRHAERRQDAGIAQAGYLSRQAATCR